nr:histidinol-phosphate transaminase [Natribacillus halophilus]
MQPREQLRHISMYSPGKPIEELQRELGITNVIKMASNENPFGSSSLAKQAITDEMENMHLYPEITAPVLANKLAKRLEVSADQLVLGNGSDEIIRMMTRSYLQDNDEVIMASVTFPRYKTNVIIDGGVPVEVPMKTGGVHDLQAMENAINKNTKMIIVCNPNNPTGTMVSAHELEAFIKRIPSHILVIIDEAYYEYIRTDDYFQSINFLDKHENLIILRTFSKIYGLASLRVGYGIMHPAIVSELLKSKEPFNVNRFAQAAAYACLDDDAFMKKTQEQNNNGRLYLENAFQRLGLSYFSTHTNFIMVDTKIPAETINDELLKNGIIIRPGHLMGYPTMIRLTIGTEEENRLFIEALEEILQRHANHYSRKVDA